MIWSDRLDGVIVQGITGTTGNAHTALMLASGTPIVAGVSRGRGGGALYGIPVYDTVREAVSRHRVTASVLFVRSADTLDAALEALAAGISTVVAIADGVPTWHALALREAAERAGALLLGPNTAGAIRPGEWKLGIAPDALYSRGPIGILSRTGSAMHELSYALTTAGIGQSLCVDIGGDMVNGSDVEKIWEGFMCDPRTRGVVILGEIGSNKEERLAAYLLRHGGEKPAAALVIGRHAPLGRRMGHAAAIARDERGTSAEKLKVLADAGVHTCITLQDVVTWASHVAD